MLAAVQVDTGLSDSKLWRQSDVWYCCGCAITTKHNSKNGSILLAQVMVGYIIEDINYFEDKDSGQFIKA